MRLARRGRTSCSAMQRAPMRSFATTPKKQQPPSKSSEAGLSIPERTRSLAALRNTGTFSTVTTKAREGPSGLMASTLSYILDDSGTPIIAVRKDAKHVEHLQEYSRGSLVIFSLVPPSFNPAKLPVPRMLISGDWKRLDLKPELRSSLERSFLIRHPAAAQFMNELDFIRVAPTDFAFYTGVETFFIDKEEYYGATVDPVVKDSRPLLEMMNGQHAAVLPRLCQEYGNIKHIDTVLLHNIDRFGFNMLAIAKEEKGWTDHRFPFPFEMKDAKQVQEALMENVEKLTGTSKPKTSETKPPPGKDQWPFTDAKW